MAKKSSDEAEQYRKDEEARQARIRAGTARINQTFDSQFTPEYYDKQRESYLRYASPQLEQQYGDASKELTYALARGGNLNSSARGEKAADLQQLYDLNKQKIADDALSFRGKTRSSVEDARASLISTLNLTGDSQGAANSAITRAAALSEPTAYSPLAQLFTDFTAGLGTQAALERANYYSGGQTGVRYNTGLFTPAAGGLEVKK